MWVSIFVIPITNCKKKTHTISATYNKIEGNQCTGSEPDVLRDFVGTAKECAFECDSRDDCVGFVRINCCSEYGGKCYLRGGTLNSISPYYLDDRDCYQPANTASETLFAFNKYEGKQCWGADDDIESDFKGTADECKTRCKELNCVGFVRVNSDGKCYFRGGELLNITEWNDDNRDCYETVAYNRIENSQCTGSESDVLRDFVGTAEECALKCDSMDDCVGFVRVNCGVEYDSKCYLRGGILSPAYSYQLDNRDCYQPLDIYWLKFNE